MGNKKKHTVADPTLTKIKEMFQQNLQLANRVQRKNKADIITKFDLTEKLYARRIKAVAHLMPEMKKRYANAYPEIDIVDEISDIASLPILSYDIIDGESHLCLGAAIWMLDQVWEIHKIQELCNLLPEDCDGVDMPEVYDTRFSYEIIERMLYVMGKQTVVLCLQTSSPSEKIVLSMTYLLSFRVRQKKQLLSS